MSLQPQMLPDKQLVLVTDSVVLVPYLPRHVARYHDWMLDPWIREMTASDPLSLPEEYDMQRLWAFDADKRTFITLDRSRLPAMSLESAAEAAAAVEAAAPALAAHAAAVPSAPSAPALAGLTGEQARALVKQLLLLPAHTRPSFDSAAVAAVAAGDAASKEEDDASDSGVDGDYSAEADAFVLVPSLVIDLRQATLTTGPLAQAAAAATADNESAASDSSAAIAAAARRDALALASIALGAPEAAVGDVNLFIHEYLQGSCNNDDDEGDDDDDDDDDGGYDDEDIALFTPAETAALHSLPRPRPRPLTAEVDIMLGDPTARGKGLALAALHALVAVAREFIGTGRLVAKIKGGNAASLKLFWGAGFAKKGYYEPFDEWELRWSEGGAQEDGRWLRQGKAAAEADKSEADAAAEGEKKRGKKLIPSVPAALDDVARRVSAQRHPGFSLMPIPLVLASTGDASPAASPEAQGETVVSPPAADAARTSTLAPRGLDALPRTGANDGWFCAWHKMEKDDVFEGYTAPV